MHLLKDKIYSFLTAIQNFEFKTISDRQGNEYVVFSDSPLASVDDIENKTMFEAVENHIHILDNVKKLNVKYIDRMSEEIGKRMLDRLKQCFPEKKFYVFVTYELHDSLIVRFHQDWPDEEPYYDNAENFGDRKRFYFA